VSTPEINTSDASTSRVTTIAIGNEHIQVTIAPTDGGRVAQITHDGFDLLIGPGPDTSAPLAWGSYPMVPWAGRVRRGRFEFDRQPYQLIVNFEGHAIHGVGFESAWEIGIQDRTTAELTLDLPSNDAWPFGGSAHQRFEVIDNRVRMELSVTAGDRPMPAMVGWHPWFVKPDALTFTPTRMFIRDDDGMPTGELVDVPDGPWDDCFLNTLPVIARIGKRQLTLTSDCDHWVVFDHRAWATCVEPQSGPPDSFTLAPHVLDSGETLAAWYDIDITLLDD
jgi:aldose 1-epimerase